jgi:cytochrome c
MFEIRTLRLFALAALLATAAGCATEIKSSSAKVNSANGDDKGNAANGRELFMANACATCHGVTKADTAMVGPSLSGVVGRKAGTSPSLLGASENLKKYGVIWSAATLGEFLADPNAKVPGTPMIGMLADPQQRADVIAYLSTLKE